VIGERDTAPARPTSGASRRTARFRSAGVRLFVIRSLNYLTNSIVAHTPSFAARRFWYSRIVGIRIGQGAGVHRGCYIWFYGPSQVRRDQISIGAYTRINRGCCLDTRGTLRIGANVSVSPEVMILSAEHRVDDNRFVEESRAPVVIDDHVFIGARAIILPGVTLGRGCVVAAGSVVTRSVEPLTIVGGVPAKPIGTRPDHATGYLLDAPFPLFE
jgi:acetyltransferase-like isoleucine patch superfamily enzyme